MPRLLARHLPGLMLLAMLLPSGPVSARQSTPIDQATVAKIDVHAHYRSDHAALIEGLQRWNMRAVLVNVASGGDITAQWEAMRSLAAAHPGRFILCATFDPFRFNEPDFPEQVIAELKEHIAQGAALVKVWKNIGLEVKDDEGRYVQIDHARFQPIWDFLAAEGLPVIAHIAEPRAAWLPLDERSPHYHYYESHPEYHAYNHPEMPRWEEIIAARDRWVARNPDLVIIGAHLGSMSHDVAEVARRLDAYPNFYVETAARFGDLALQPSDSVRAFMLRYQDRILYGTDVSDSSVENDRLDGAFGEHWAYLASPDAFYFGSRTYWGVDTKGLGLPRDVLEKIYHRNAERLLAD